MALSSIGRFNVSKCWEIRSRHNHCLEFNCYRESLVETVVNFWNSQTDWGSIYNMSRQHPRGLCRVMNKCRQNIVQVSHIMHWQELHFDIFLYITLRCRYWLYQTIDYIYYMFDYICRKKYTYPCFAQFFFSSIKCHCISNLNQLYHWQITFISYQKLFNPPGCKSYFSLETHYTNKKEHINMRSSVYTLRTTLVLLLRETYDFFYC